MSEPRRVFPVLAALCAVVWLLLMSGPVAGPAARELPSTLTDAAFWRMVTEFSEAGGTFPSNNFVSNEWAFQTIIPRLKASVPQGGVYLGVGPDQNFTYIAALRPRMAFIVDIRRQNMLHHLLYKALMELSPTRADFLMRLFGRPRPLDISESNAPDVLLEGLEQMLPSEELFAKYGRDVREVLVTKHHLPLTEDDLKTIQFVHRAFFEGGPNLTYAGPVGRLTFMTGLPLRDPSPGPFPTYAELMMQSDGPGGTNHAYLATEGHYRVVRDLHLKNLIVPVVGDFAGPKAIRAVASYVAQQNGTVTTFYLSNVEQYLFQNGTWGRFYENVATLPLGKNSSFIRAVFPSQSVPVILSPGDQFVFQPPNGRLPTWTRLCPIGELLADVKQKTIVGYQDVVAMCSK